MKLISVLSAMILLLAGDFAFAANHYIRSDAAGSGNGSDWTNAYTSLPSSLIRGDTYYIADGSYPTYTFDDPESGTLVITIKKATAADHGTETGWQAAFGDGQATFNSVLTFSRSYYVFDGQTRNESNWFDGASYGFRVYHNNQDQNIVLQGTWPKAANYITVKNTYVEAIYGNLPNTTIRRYAIDTDTYGGDIGVGQIFSRMYVYGSNNVWFLRSTKGAIVEYSAHDGAQSNSANHGEVVNLYYSGTNATVRYNQWRNAYSVGAGGTALVAITQADGLQFYGNLAYNFQVGDGAIGFDGYSSSHNRIYNNTFIKGTGYNSGMRWGSGTDNLIYNNIFVGCSVVGIEGTHDYNAFSDPDSRGEVHAQVSVSTSIFTNYAGNDFTLKTATAAGLGLVSPFNADSKGLARGADGIWDRGAFEFSTTGATSTPTPSPTATPVPTATPAPTATPVPTATPAIIGETLLGASVPATIDANDGVAYELGMKFSSISSGQISAIRFYKSPSESGSHTGKIYSSTGALLASVIFANESASGWQIAYLAAPLTIAANTTYTVSVNTGAGYYVDTAGDFAAAKSSANLRAPVSAGVYGAVGAMPSTTWSDASYFRDVVFVASSTATPTPTPAPTATPVPTATPAPTATPIPGDSVAPSVSIITPVDGSTVSRGTKVTIMASASDNVGVTRVEFYVNGSLNCTDTTAAYSCSWSVSRGRNIPYALQAKAYDAAGNVRSSAIVNVTSR